MDNGPKDCFWLGNILARADDVTQQNRPGAYVRLDKIKNPVLYSTMSWLTYNINMTYYGGVHYMWCTPYFGSNFQSPHFMVPPSSSPLEIYKMLRDEIDGVDLHGTKIKLNKMGVRRGAEIMKARGIIDIDQMREIHAICNKVPPEQFRPLLCIIPRMEAIPYYEQVDVMKKANPLSHEYIVADLPQAAFDVIRIG